MPGDAAPTIVEPQGELDLHHSPALKEQFDSIIGAKRRQVIVDLSAVSYIDSSGLAVLIEALQGITAYGGKFAVCGLQENVQHIFSIARLDQVFRIFSTREAAIAT